MSPRLRPLLLALLGALTLSGSLSACGPDFEPYWRVQKLRIIGMKASPVTLRPGDTSTLEVLRYIPPGASVTYQWDWCPFQTGPAEEYECPITREQLLAQFKQGINPEELPPGTDVDALLDALFPQFDLGTNESASFSYPGPDPSFIRGLCQSLQGSLTGEDNDLAGMVNVSDCEDGYEVTFRVVLTDTNGKRYIGGKRLLLWTGSALPDNINPELDAIQIRLENPGDFSKVSSQLDWVIQDSDDDKRWYTLPEDAPTPILANIPYELRNIMDPDSIEVFQRRAPTGAEEEFLPPAQEALEYRWFVGGGDLGDSSPLYAPGLNELADSSLTSFSVSYDLDARVGGRELEENQDVDWDLDGVENASDNCPSIINPGQEDANEDGLGDGCTISIWALARDGRLGIDWLERQVTVIDAIKP